MTNMTQPPVINQQVQQKKKMPKWAVILLIIVGALFVLCVLIGLFSPKSSTATETPALTNTPVLPTNTLGPTSTPEPTATATTAPTNTPLPQPVTLEGNGDKVVDFTKTWSGPSILKITNKGSSNFVVENYDSEGNQIDLLVNEIGSYSGTQLIGIMIYEADTTRFSIESSGAWSITAYPFDLSLLDQVSAPGHLDGKGDDVVAINGNADLITGADTGESNFIIYALDDSNESLIFNEIGPYSGQKVLPSGSVVLIILCQDSWSIDLTAK